MSEPLNESTLLEAIKLFGADVYEGDHPTLRDRIGHTIAVHRIATVIAWRGPDRKVETFGQAFKRVYGMALPSVSRGSTQHNHKVPT